MKLIINSRKKKNMKLNVIKEMNKIKKIKKMNNIFTKCLKN